MQLQHSNRTTTIKSFSLFFLLTVVWLNFPIAADELETLQNNYDSAEKRALSPIRKTYQEQLQVLKKKAISRGDLALAARTEAEAAKFERKALGGLPFPAGQTWEWEGQEVTITFEKDGNISTSNGSWEARGLVTKWKNLGDDHVLLRIVKGRSDQLIALLVFNEKETEFTGWGFGGDTLAPKRRLK